jgi:hypothetical protein
VGRILNHLVGEFHGASDPHVRQGLAVLHTRRAIMGYTNQRMRSSSVPGLEGPSRRSPSRTSPEASDLGLAVQGAYGMLTDDDAPSGRLPGLRPVQPGHVHRRRH